MAGRYACLAILGVLMLAVPVRAQTFESVGIRASGMAGAFVAVADDATAVYWNPAGLAAGAFLSAVVERSSIDLGRLAVVTQEPGIPVGPTLRLQDGSGTLVAMGVPPLGVAYYRLRATAFEGELTERRHEARGATLVTDNVAVNLLQSLADGVHVGASLRVVRGSAGVGIGAGPSSDPDDLLDAAASLERRSSWAFDADAGLLVVRGRWRAGLVGRNLVAPSFDAPTGERLSLSRQVRAGAAFQPRAGTMLALDADLTRTRTGVGDARHLAVGAEQLLGARLTVRGGLRLNTIDDARPAGALGASVGVTSSISIDAQVTRGGREAERTWGLGLRFGF